MWERKIENMYCTVMIIRTLKHKRATKRKPLMLFALVCKIPSQFIWLLSDPPWVKTEYLRQYYASQCSGPLHPPDVFDSISLCWQPWRENPLVFTLQPHRLKIPVNVQPRRLLENTVKNKTLAKQGRAQKSLDSCWLSTDVYLKHESAKLF